MPRNRNTAAPAPRSCRPAVGERVNRYAAGRPSYAALEGVSLCSPLS